MNTEELNKILEKHKKWLRGEDGGERADLSWANLSGAYLSGACLSGADLSSETKIDNLDRYFPQICPSHGSFIGWKKTRQNLIVKLQIPEDAKRSSAFGRKCRCDKAVVLEIQNLDGSKSDIAIAVSGFDPKFAYIVGKEVSVDNFCDDRKKECATGIHFFVTRQEAVDYIL